MSVHDSEHLARFISSEGWLNKGRVKGDAFRPNKNHRRLETSVTRHDGTDLEQIRTKGNAWASSGRSRPLSFFGWANVVAESVRLVPPLNVENAATYRDPNHANIIGWDVEEGKQTIQAEDVARQSAFIPNPT